MVNQITLTAYSEISKQKEVITAKFDVRVHETIKSLSDSLLGYWVIDRGVHNTRVLRYKFNPGVRTKSGISLGGLFTTYQPLLGVEPCTKRAGVDHQNDPYDYTLAMYPNKDRHIYKPLTVHEWHCWISSGQDWDTWYDMFINGGKIPSSPQITLGISASEKTPTIIAPAPIVTSVTTKARASTTSVEANQPTIYDYLTSHGVPNDLAVKYIAGTYK